MFTFPSLYGINWESSSFASGCARHWSIACTYICIDDTSIFGFPSPCPWSVHISPGAALLGSLRKTLGIRFFSFDAIFTCAFCVYIYFCSVRCIRGSGHQWFFFVCNAGMRRIQCGIRIHRVVGSFREPARLMIMSFLFCVGWMMMMTSKRGLSKPLREVAFTTISEIMRRIQRFTGFGGITTSKS